MKIIITIGLYFIFLQVSANTITTTQQIAPISSLKSNSASHTNKFATSQIVNYPSKKLVTLDINEIKSYFDSSKNHSLQTTNNIDSLIALFEGLGIFVAILIGIFTLVSGAIGILLSIRNKDLHNSFMGQQKQIQESIESIVTMKTIQEIDRQSQNISKYAQGKINEIQEQLLETHILIENLINQFVFTKEAERNDELSNVKNALLNIFNDDPKKIDNALTKFEVNFENGNWNVLKSSFEEFTDFAKSFNTTALARLENKNRLDKIIDLLKN